MYDTFYVCAKSEGGKQTKRTQERQKDFAMAASLSAAIRKALRVAIPNSKKRTMQNRLTKACMQWIQTNPFNQTQSQQQIAQLKSFSFTEEASVPKLFNAVTIQTDQLTGTLTLTISSFIPKKTIHAPAGTKQLLLTIAAASLGAKRKSVITNVHHQLTIPYKSKPVEKQTIGFNFKLQENCISLVAVTINYFVKQHNSQELQMVKQHKWKPSAIVFAQMY